MAMNYLNQKYPETEFEIVMGNPQNKMNSFAEFIFKEVGKSDTFQLSISKMNDEYAIKDNYYGSLIREAYDKYIYSKDDNYLYFEDLKEYKNNVNITYNFKK